MSNTEKTLLVWGVERGITEDLPDTRLVKKAMPYIQKIISKLK